MDGSTGVGFIAVFAVSSSVAFVAHQAHKRLVSDFMKKIQFEFGSSKECRHSHKKAGFSSNVPAEPSSSKSSGAKGPRTKDMGNGNDRCLKASPSDEKNLEGTMPLNRLALYRGIIEFRMHFPRDGYGVYKGGRGFGLFTC